MCTPRQHTWAVVIYYLYKQYSNVIKYGKIYMYADDTTLAVSSSDVKDISMKLEPDLESLSKWLSDNKLFFFNTDKKEGYVSWYQC